MSEIYINCNRCGEGLFTTKRDATLKELAEHGGNDNIYITAYVCDCLTNQQKEPLNMINKITIDCCSNCPHYLGETAPERCGKGNFELSPQIRNGASLWFPIPDECPEITARENPPKQVLRGASLYILKSKYLESLIAYREKKDTIQSRFMTDIGDILLSDDDKRTANKPTESTP